MLLAYTQKNVQNNQKVQKEVAIKIPTNFKDDDVDSFNLDEDRLLDYLEVGFSFFIEKLTFILF